jgi:signal transduction histidine kinase
MQVTPGVGFSALSALVSVAVAAYAARRQATGATAVAAFAGATGIWAGANAVQGAVTTLDAKLLADSVQYVGIAAVPVSWFAFAAAYSGREQWVNRRTLGALSVIPAVTVVLAFTNAAHGLLFTNAHLETVNGAVTLKREFGVGFWAITAYSNVVNSVGTVMLLEAALRAGRYYRKQALVVLAGGTVPWVFTVAFLSGVSPFEPEVSFGVTSLAFGYAIYGYGLGELAPIARDRVFEEFDDGVVVIDSDGCVADYNPAAERLLGVDLAVSDPLRDRLPDPVAAALDADDSDPVAVDDDRWVTVETASVGEQAPGELVLFHDVTELERRRAELDRENARLEAVADTISHDLRNPLSVASGSLELARQTGSEDDFERAEDALDRMDDIIESTLRVARTGLDAPDESAVPLRKVAERAWRNVPTENATLDAAAADATVRADHDQLESLLENLFRNAVEHGSTDSQTPPESDGAATDGTVTVTVAATDGGFYVADDGPGIPDGEREQVFERGYTTSDEGTGLGLAIVCDIADAHGWRVSLGESGDGGVRLDVAGVERAEEQRRA